MLPFFWTLELSRAGPEAVFPRPLFGDLLKEVKAADYVEVTLVERWDRFVQGASPFAAFAEMLEKRGLPYRLRLTGFYPISEADLGQRLARLRHLEEVEVEMARPAPPADDDPRAPEPLDGWIGWGVPVSATLPFTVDLLEDVEDVVDRLVTAGMRRVRFDRLAPRETAALDEEDVRQITGRVTTIYHEGHPVAIRGCLPFCHTPALFQACGGGVYSVHLEPDGTARPCRYGPTTFGNVNGAPLRYLWNSAAVARWQDGQAEACQTCPVFHSCRSGCRALLSEGFPDPLIVGFKRRHMPAPIDHPLSLDETLQVEVRARRCHYKFGDFLVHSGRVVPVAPRWSRLLESLEKKPSSLREVRLTQGEEAVRLLFSLYLEGAVRLHPASEVAP